MNSRKKLAIVTGGSSGIGRAVALKLAGDGWHVCVADINLAGGEETLQALQRAGGTGRVERLDVSSQTDWSRLLTTLRSDHEHLGLLVNNAGVCAGGEFERTSLETWDWVQSINLRGGMLGCSVMVPWLKENPERSYILNIASIAGLVYSPRMAPYNVSKAALVALSETLYHELRPHNIGVTVVCPWFCATNLLENGKFSTNTELDYAKREMSYTLVTPEKVARKALAAMYWGRPVRVIGFRANLIWSMKRYVPSLAWRAVDLLYYFNVLRSETRPPAEASPHLPPDISFSNPGDLCDPVDDQRCSESKTALLQSSQK